MKEPLLDMKGLEKKINNIDGENFLEKIQNRDPAKLNKILFEIEQYYGTKDILNKDLEELLKNLEIHILTQKKEALIPLIKKEDKKAKEEFDNISKKLDKLK